LTTTDVPKGEVASDAKKERRSVAYRILCHPRHEATLAAPNDGDLESRMKFTKTTPTTLAIALAMLATPALAEVVLVPGVGARTVVPFCGNSPRAPREGARKS
jgi:hypothetical protein